MSLKLNTFDPLHYTCSDHSRPVKLMVSSVTFTPGCEDCTRAAFAEALERALKEKGNV